MYSRAGFSEYFEKMYSFYGPQGWWPAESAFEVCIGAILTQNTSWVNVEKAIKNLKAANALDHKKLLTMEHNDLAGLIRPSGFFNVKSRRIRSFLKWVEQHFNGSLENMFIADWLELRDELLMIEGVGPETCDSILLYAGNKPSFVVDSYTNRLFRRLGLLQGAETYQQVREAFMLNLPAEVWVYNEYHALIVEHCKRFCRKKPLCTDCPLNNTCMFCKHDCCSRQIIN
jgi:endonuclease III related protein